MKIEMSLSAHYVSHWGWEQAFRELLQNALDCKTFVTEYDHENQSVVIFTADGAIPRQSLLLGESGKRNGDTIGHFGEGLKLAMLILAREGYPMRVYSGKEIWIPHMEHSELYDCQALVIDIEENPEGDADAVEIIVDGITPDMASEIDGMYIKPDQYQKALATSNGSQCFEPIHLLTESEEADMIDKFGDCESDWEIKSKVYVGGLFVSYLNGNFRYSYNFKPSCVKLDRDRMTVNTWDIQWEISKLLAAAGRADLVVDLTEGKYADMDGYSQSHTSYYGGSSGGCSSGVSYSDKLKDLAVDSFIKRFGQKAIPISKDEDENKSAYYAQQCVKLGYTPIYITGKEFSMLDGAIKMPDNLISVDKPQVLRILRSWVAKYTEPDANKDDGVIEIMELVDQLNSYEQFMGIAEVEEDED
ncbi:hypothetical protein [Burkholderia pseudomallei]|jgi:hypothetical protein|uniref:hypothetical protein n=1 Tax=Burkholderia pseudomallei TaxID=28450 RepID=UPI0024DF8E82|nr:hypothetical protein [Burkholderia pseudomallei]